MDSMESQREGPPGLRPLCDAEFYALSEREQLAYLTRMLLELDRLQLKQLRESGTVTPDFGDVRH
jgi:hypothetical protein